MNRNARLKENQEVFRSANERLSDVVEAGLAPVTRCLSFVSVRMRSAWVGST